MAKTKDITGVKFGRLTAIRKSGSNKNGSFWLCKCDCGKEVIIRRSGLVSGNTKSCGCLNNELRSQRILDRCLKYNNYDLSGEYGIGYTNKGEKFYFDLEDYDKIKDYCWTENNGYLCCVKESLLLHRLIMGCNTNMVVDHINHNTLDNRKINLRVCSQHENTMNTKVSTNNTSGVTGVCWVKRMKKWCAYIMKNYKKIHLGFFYSFDEAVTARKKAEEKYFGEYAYNKGSDKIV